MEEDKSKGYWFAVGSFVFRDFKDLYIHVNERSVGFVKPCSIVKDGKGLFQFTLKYEGSRLGKKKRFILEWDHKTLAAFNSDPLMSKDLRAYLPGFKRIGCTVQGSVAAERLYGYVDISKL